MFRLVLVLYNLVFPLVFLLYLPFYLVHLARRGNFLNGFGERFGLYSKAKRKALRGLQRPVWVHAVSVGETVAALSFIRAWQAREPELRIVLSSTTSTGQAIARSKAPEGVVPIYCPVDWWPCVAAALRAIRPRMVVIFEVEVWPTIIATAARRMPVALVNCRMSDSTADGYSNYAWFFRPLLRHLAWIGAQTSEDAARLQRVVGEGTTVEVCNTMKFDQTPDQEAVVANEWLDRAFGDGERLVFTAASTHAGEEEIMIGALRDLLPAHPTLRLLLVPRHVERMGELEPVLVASGLPWCRLTALREGRQPPADCRILVGDTTGEMMAFLALSDIVFVGKSLGGQEGGHNIIEPAIFGKPILFGDHMENFRRVAQIFKSQDAAVEVDSPERFVAELRRLLEEPAERQRLSQASRRTVEEQRGATARTIDRLQAL